MIEGLKGASATRRNNPSPAGESHQTVESVAIAGATAIQHLITERDSLRGRARAQEDELVGLRAANEDLRRHLTLIRDHYLGLATGVVTELNQIDHLFQAALQRAQDVTNEPDDGSLISLAERLSPHGERANRIMDAH
jgi:hypothetical protein